MYNYVFNYTDHLGNIRLSYGFDTATNSVTVLEENNYYPFGLKHNNYNVSKLSYGKSGLGSIVLCNCPSGYTKKYLGQNFEEELGLNWYSFRYRNGDPAIGRFFGIDPVSEDYTSISTYQFAHNNPVWKIEIEGLEGATTSGQDVINEEPNVAEKVIAWGSEFIFSAVGIITGGPKYLSTVAPRETIANQIDETTGQVERAVETAKTIISDPIAAVESVGDSVVQSVRDLISGDPEKTAGAVIAIAPLFIEPQASAEGAMSKLESGAAKLSEKTLPKSGKGKGSVAPSQRDPKRFYSKSERGKLLEKQDGKCAGCGEKKKVEQVQGHHKVRHADGGRTNQSNGAAVCETCHKEAHK